MSNQTYYGYPGSYSYPQQPQYAPQQPNAPYNNGQGYVPPYVQNNEYRAPSSKPQEQVDMSVGPGGERGLGATIVGGSAGGWAARKAGAGFWGSLASATAGAVGANVFENKFKKHRKNKA